MPDVTGVPIGPEVEEFLQNHSRTFLVTLRKDGSPTAHPMGGVYRDGALYFNTYRRSPKVRNIERDDRASCLVTSSPDSAQPQAVLFRGRARIVPWETAYRRPAGGQKISEAELSRTEQRLKDGKRTFLQVVQEQAGFLDELRGG